MTVPKKDAQKKKEYPIRFTLKSIYGESTWTKDGHVSASSNLSAQYKAKELAAKTELHLSGSLITKIEVKSLNFKTFQEEWREITI